MVGSANSRYGQGEQRDEAGPRRRCARLCNCRCNSSKSSQWTAVSLQMMSDQRPGTKYPHAGLSLLLSPHVSAPFIHVRTDCQPKVGAALSPYYHPHAAYGWDPHGFFSLTANSAGAWSVGSAGTCQRGAPSAACTPPRLGPGPPLKRTSFVAGIWLDTSPTQKLALPLPLVLAFHCRGWHAAILWLLLARRGRLGAACAVVAPASALAASAAACAPEPVLLCCCAAPSAASDDSHRCAARRGGTHPATSCHPPKSVLPPATAPKSQHRGLQHNPPPTPARR